MGGAGALAMPGCGYANTSPSIKGLLLLKNFPEFDDFMQSGLLQSHVAGRFVNEFARHLRFENLPPQLIK